MEALLKKLKALLESFEGADAETVTKLLEDYSTEDLVELRKAAESELKAIDDPAQLETAVAYDAGRKIIAAEVEAREAKAQEEADKLAALKEGLEPDEEAEGEEVEEADAETVETPEVVEERVPVAAAASFGPAISTLDRRIEAESRPVTNLDVTAVTAGAASGRTFADTDGLDVVGDVFYNNIRRVTSGKDSLVHLEYNYPEERRLNMSPEENTRRLNAVMGTQAIVAAGGICEPVPADFEHPICSDRGRPIRDGLPSFQLLRGGIRFAPAATIGDLSDAITVWSADTDSDPGSAIKACPHVDCEEEDSAEVSAIVRCLTVGNFQAKFNPEFFESRLRLLLVEHDRAAEVNSYNQILAESTSVDAADYTGTIQNVLIALDTAASGLRSRHRLTRGTAIRAILPDWIDAALRSHLAAQNPGGNPDQYAHAMDNWYAVRNIRPIWSPDVEVFSSQTTGNLNDFPAEITVPVFPEGTFVFGDGGTLDLGTEVRDSELNSVNDRQVFAETFEVTFKRGCESLAVDIPLGIECICPAGS